MSDPSRGDSLRLATPGTDDALMTSGDADERDRLASRAFHFPYPKAYPIQLDLMRAVFRAIEDGHVGLFESPTGTGKSLSLICAACTWLQMNAERHTATAVQNADDHAALGTNDEPDWVLQHGMQRDRDTLQKEEQELRRRIAGARQRQAQQRRSAAVVPDEKGSSKRGRPMTIGADQPQGGDSDDDFLVDDYQRDDGSLQPASTDPDDPASYLSPAVRALMEQTGSYVARKDKAAKPFFAKKKGVAGVDEEDDDEEPETTPKIIYVSRTHSQLSQFVGELKRTVFGKPSAREELTDVSTDGETLSVRMIALGSRKQMCINNQVVALGDRLGVEAMNERCLELMKKPSGAQPTKNAKARCRFLPSADAQGQVKMLDYRDNVFAGVRDIEEAVELGRSMHTCSYFGARGSAKQAHVITMPYNLLLSATARASLNIDLKGSVVIVDEAHNLIDTILATHTVVISEAQVRRGLAQLQVYLRRFAGRLKGLNEVNLKKLTGVLNGIEAVCKSSASQSARSETISSAELVRRIGGNVDQVNLMELERWLRETKIARKVAGYTDKQEQRQAEKEGGDKHKTGRGAAVSGLHAIEAFLLSLANRDLDGRVFVTSHPTGNASDAASSTVTLKYQLLNPADVFSKAVQDARSVILAGGTMEPISDFQQQLFPHLDPARLTRFSCSHIIPPSNLLAMIVGKGAKGVPLEFKYDARSSPALLDELTTVLTNYCSVIPHGVVVFVPSYGFLDALKGHWVAAQKRDINGGLARLSARKRVFYEPKRSSDVDGVLREYGHAAEAVDGKRAGALLFAVVGAKLSEGINFSDRLARAVVMVGMPFANVNSPELAERMKYVRGLAAARATKVSTGVDAGQELYVNLCMKAVNQSVGRAIRHQNDYAALIFLDARYARQDVRDRLPQWIRQRTTVHDGFGPSMAALGAFFRGKGKG